MSLVLRAIQRRFHSNDGKCWPTVSSNANTLVSIPILSFFRCISPKAINYSLVLIRIFEVKEVPQTSRKEDRLNDGIALYVGSHSDGTD